MKLMTRAAYEARVRRPSLLDVAENKAAYIDLAEGGDAPAAMALFHLESARTVQCRDGVRSVTEGDRDAAWRWLDLAARHGDCTAITQYARSLPSRLRDDVEQADEGVVTALRGKAIAYLRVAAERGFRDAFLYLADAWETGSAGHADPVLALTYHVAWNRLDGDAGTRRAVRRLERRCSVEGRERASTAASALVRIVRASLRRARRSGA